MKLKDCKPGMIVYYAHEIKELSGKPGNLGRKGTIIEIDNDDMGYPIKVAFEDDEYPPVSVNWQELEPLPLAEDEHGNYW